MPCATGGRVRRDFGRMKKSLCLSALLAGLLAAAGCHADATATAEAEDQRSPLAGSSGNSLNSPTAGPTSEGLPGGTEAEAREPVTR